MSIPIQPNLGASPSFQPPTGRGTTTSPALAAVLKGLDLSPKVRLHKQPGANLDGLEGALKDVSMMSQSSDLSHLSESLGLKGAVSFAVVVQSGDELRKIRKRLREMQEQILEPDVRETVFEALNLPDNVEFSYKLGGLFIVQSALEKLEEEDEEEGEEEEAEEEDRDRKK